MIGSAEGLSLVLYFASKQVLFGSILIFKNDAISGNTATPFVDVQGQWYLRQVIAA